MGLYDKAIVWVTGKGYTGLKYAAASAFVGLSSSVANRGLEAVFDATTDLAGDYVRDKVSSAFGTDFENPWLKSFMSSLSMGVTADCSSYVMGLSMKTNMYMQGKIDEKAEKINDYFNKKRAEVLASGDNDKAIAIQLENVDRMRYNELNAMNAQGSQYVSQVNGAGVSSGAYTQGLGTMKSAFQATIPQNYQDPNLIKIMNGMGYFPDKAV